MLRPRLLLAIGLVATVALTACSGDEPVAATSTTGTALPTRTSVTQVPIPTTAGTGTTTTTVPAEIATSIDACALLAPAEVEALIGGDPGPGREIETQGQPRVDEDGATTTTTTPPTTIAAPGSRSDDVVTAPPPGTTTDPEEAPSLLLSTCAWPTDGPNEVLLTYLAPTTAGSSREHLQRLVDRATPFADGARVFPLTPVQDLAPAALVKDDEVIEVATVRGSALVYLTQDPPPASGSREAERLVSALLLAAARSPG